MKINVMEQNINSLAILYILRNLIYMLTAISRVLVGKNIRLTKQCKVNLIYTTLKPVIEPKNTYNLSANNCRKSKISKLFSSQVSRVFKVENLDLTSPEQPSKTSLSFCTGRYCTCRLDYYYY